MGKKIYITEKPSVAESFANVLGISINKGDKFKGYAESNDSIVTWCYGHLITMAYPEEYNSIYKEWKIEHLPIMPSEYKYIVIDNISTKKQFEIIKGLFQRKDVDTVYACTDSGREGEYIFRLVYQNSSCVIPAKRVWISSQTEEAIKEGIKNAKNIEQYDMLSKSAYCRAKEDWLFGMNFSRIYTLKFGRKLSNILKENKSSVIAVGRVMTCVLGLLVDRELEIRNFVPKTHYGISANFLSLKSNINYIGKWQPNKDDEGELEVDKYITKEEATKIIEKLNGKQGKVKKIINKTKNEMPPLLFNLAELQSEANKKFKMPVDKTLQIAQTLYEKKMITYPRTDSRVLSTDIVEEFPKIFNGLNKNSAYAQIVSKIKESLPLKVSKTTKRYVDNKKVTDHYAIIPTYVTYELNKLDQDSRNIYDLIVKRFLAIFYPEAKYNTIKVETEVSGELFVTNAKILISLGWKEIYNTVPSKDEQEVVDVPLNKLIKNEQCESLKFTLDEKQTKPPPKYTDGTLIITMEKAGKFVEDEELREKIKTCGIGTSATRAGIIKKLIDIKYIEINSKTQIITPTKKGEEIVNFIKETAKELLSPSLSASWEKGLVMIENNETTEEVFLEKLNKYIVKTITKVKSYKLKY